MTTEPEDRPEDQEATPDADLAADSPPAIPDALLWTPPERREPGADLEFAATPAPEEAGVVDFAPDVVYGEPPVPEEAFEAEESTEPAELAESPVEPADAQDTDSPDEAAAAATVAAAAATLAAGRRPGRTPWQSRPPKPPKQPKPPKPPKEPKPLKEPKAARIDRGRVRLIVASWFTDPAKRVRLIIWAGVVVMLGFGFMAIALGVTSSYWFCANACHKVQDDTIIAYNRTAHSEISCMACHMPVNADPVTFMIHKATALGELYQTVTNQFELPLNPEDETALKMPSAICEQCHGTTRPITASVGIKIDHAAHSSRGIACPICHNRTAHIEDFKLTLPDNRKHPDWMSMEACYRCHSLDPKAKGFEGFKAPGTCATCHPPTFSLKPNNHKVGADFQKTHPVLVKLKGKAYCLMCHNEKTFCFKCHGVPMPHPPDFQKLHGTLFKAGKVSQDVFRSKVCQRCHGAGAGACNNCHHDYPGYNQNVPWLIQHPLGAAALGPNACFSCHDVQFCPVCHVNIGRGRPTK